MNKIYFVSRRGASDLAVLCDAHAAAHGPTYDAVSEPLDDSDEHCVLCLERLKGELLETATEIIDVDGRGLRLFFELIAGLLDARAESDDDDAHLFKIAREGTERTLTNIVEVEFDKYSEGDAVVLAREVERQGYTVPLGSTGIITRITDAGVIVKLDREVSGAGGAPHDTLLFDDCESEGFKSHFLRCVRKVSPAR